VQCPGDIQPLRGALVAGGPIMTTRTDIFFHYRKATVIRTDAGYAQPGDSWEPV
jgi:hypothetical protein